MPLAKGIAIQGGGYSAVLRELVRRSIVLVVLGGALGAAAWRVGTQRPLGTLTLGIYVAVVVLLVLCEQLLTFDRDWGGSIRGSRTDVSYAILAAAMDKVVFVVCVTAIALVGRRLADHLQIAFWPTGRSFLLQVVLALLIADAAAYFRHRLFHRSSLLWRFHRIHHSMTELYWIRSAYTHPLEQLCILMAIMLPIAFLGAGDEVVAVVAFLFGLSGLLQHANIDARSSVLNYVFATPEVHRMHHGAESGADTRNFSAFFVVMDALFGTYQRPPRVAAPLRVGLEGVTAFPRDFLSHLAMPFRELEGDGYEAGATSGGPA